MKNPRLLLTPMPPLPTTLVKRRHNTRVQTKPLLQKTPPFQKKLNFWHQARKKRQANRNNHRPSPKRGSFKAHRKSSKPSPTPKRSKRPPTKVLSVEMTTSSHGKIPRTDAQHRSINKTHTVTTPQQVHRPSIPPQRCDPLPSIEHKTPPFFLPPGYSEQQCQPYTPIS